MNGEEALKALKREIALNRYEVDSGAVADAILSKLRLLRSGQAALASSAADRTPRLVAVPPRGR
jgi:hypothetical protein